MPVVPTSVPRYEDRFHFRVEELIRCEVDYEAALFDPCVAPSHQVPTLVGPLSQTSVAEQLPENLRGVRTRAASEISQLWVRSTYRGRLTPTVRQ